MEAFTTLTTKYSKKMPDKFTEIVTQAYRPWIENMFGNFSDIAAKNNYRDTMAEMHSLSQERDNIFRYRDISRRLAVNPLTDNDIYNTNLGFDSEEISKSEPSILENTTAYKDFQTYLNQISEQNKQEEESGSTKTTPMQFADFVMKNSAHTQELYNLKYIKPIKTLKPDEELLNTKLKKAGITPEDYQFYNDYGPKYNPAGHNQRYINLLNEREPGLISTGPLGSSLAQNFERMVKANLINTDPTKVKTDIKDGYILQTDEYGNILKREKLDNDPNSENTTVADTKPNDWTVEKVGEKYYWYADTFTKGKGWQKEKVRELSETEKTEYLQKLEDDEVKRTNRSKGKSGRRYSRVGDIGGEDADVYKEMNDYLKYSAKYDRQFGTWDTKATGPKKDAQTKLNDARKKLISYGMSEKDIDAALKKYRSGKNFTKTDFKTIYNDKGDKNTGTTGKNNDVVENSINTDWIDEYLDDLEQDLIDMHKAGKLTADKQQLVFNNLKKDFYSIGDKKEQEYAVQSANSRLKKYGIKI